MLGDDMKDELRSDGVPVVAGLEYYTEAAVELRRPDPPLEFPGEQEIFLDMSTRKKRKQVEDAALIG